MDLKKLYYVDDLDALDEFDTNLAYLDYGAKYSVMVVSSGRGYSPVYHFRENGDMDGLLGWGVVV